MSCVAFIVRTQRREAASRAGEGDSQLATSSRYTALLTLHSMCHKLQLFDESGADSLIVFV